MTTRTELTKTSVRHVEVKATRTGHITVYDILEFAKALENADVHRDTKIEYAITGVGESPPAPRLAQLSARQTITQPAPELARIDDAESKA